MGSLKMPSYLIGIGGRPRAGMTMAMTSVASQKPGMASAKMATLRAA